MLKSMNQMRSRPYARTFFLLLIITTLAFIPISIRQVNAYSPTVLVSLGIFYIAILLLGYKTWMFFLVKREDTVLGNASPVLLIKTVAISLLLAFALEFATLVGSPALSPLSIDDWTIRRMFLLAVLSYAAALFFLETWKRGRFKELLAKVGSCVRTRGRIAVPVLALVVLLAIIAAWVCNYVFSLSLSLVFCFVLLLEITVIFLVVLRGDIALHPERGFLAIALCLGSFMALGTPATTVSWDEQIHYQRATDVSYIYGSEYTEADLFLFNPLLEDERVDRPGKWSSLEIEQYHQQLEALDSTGNIQVNSGFMLAKTYSLSYIPSAIGLWLGRLLSLPFASVFAMGRLFGLFAYILICYFAIKIIPVKKMLLCVLALIPTNIFLASHYSYDPWITSLVFLAVALTVREMMTPDKRITAKTYLGILLLFFLALLPKAVYFPLLGLLFMMPKSKFTSSRNRILYYASILIVGLAVVCTFALPFLASSGSSVTDARGGADVSSSGQLSFVLTNPLRYCSIVGSFLFGDYFTLEKSNGFTVSFAYLGDLGEDYILALSGFPVLWLAFVSLLDSNRLSNSLKSSKRLLWSLFLFLMTVILVATSMYISFTPVGLDTVNGCQPRYLIPLLLPLFLFCLNFRLENKMNTRIFCSAVLLLSAVLLAVCECVMVLSRMIA